MCWMAIAIRRCWEVFSEYSADLKLLDRVDLRDAGDKAEVALRIADAYYVPPTPLSSIRMTGIGGDSELSERVQAVFLFRFPFLCASTRALVSG